MSKATPLPSAPQMIPRRVFLSYTGAAVAAFTIAPPMAAQAEDRGSPGRGCDRSGRGDGQPYAFYWFPDSLPPSDREPPPGAVWRSLLDWNPRTDPDLAFNVSTVPLASRSTPRPLHRGQHRHQTRVQSLVSFGPTADNPSQGSASADYYAFTHWSYVDELVFWGGSSGEGIILAPNAPVVDAAHRAGVRVLGNVFLPPVAYGGLPQWTLDLVHEVNGRFPVAEKMVQAARVLGFDGWFINAETSLQDIAEDPAAVARRMQRFLQFLESQGMRTVWYDAMTENGEIDWQNALNERNDSFLQDGPRRISDEIFLNFGWTRADVDTTLRTAAAIGRPVYDSHFGIDTEANGINTRVRWDELFDPNGVGKYRGSIGLYRPEWTKNSQAENFDLARFQQLDHTYWVGHQERPTLKDGSSGWPGIAAYVPERTTLRSLPFTSAFGTGAGTGFYVDGRRVSDTPWNNLSIQDVQPQRQWVVSGSALNPRYDYDQAYQAGECLAFDLSAEAGTCLLFLFDRVRIPHGAVIEAVSSGSGSISFQFVTDHGPIVVPAAPQGPSKSGRWRRWTADFRHLAGRRLMSVSIRLRGTGTFRLGQLSIRHHWQADPAQVHHAQARRSGPGVRIRWTRPTAVHHVEVWADGRFAGATAGKGIYLPKPARRIELVSVSDHYLRSRGVKVDPC